MKRQVKRSNKKHLSKVTFRKIIYQQDVWRVYKHTGTDKYYEAYKEPLNANNSSGENYDAINDVKYEQRYMITSLAVYSALSSLSKRTPHPTITSIVMNYFYHRRISIHFSATSVNFHVTSMPGILTQTCKLKIIIKYLIHDSSAPHDKKRNCSEAPATSPRPIMPVL